MRNRKIAVRLLGGSLAAILAGAAPSANAQDLPAARAFVTRLYAGYKTAGPGYPDYTGRQAQAVFAPALLRLIRRDAAETPKGDVGALDGDPICDCQDSDGLRLTNVELTAVSKDRATAAVSLVFAGGETRRLKFDLVHMASGWRVDDIHSADTPSLAAFLRQHAGGR